MKTFNDSKVYYEFILMMTDEAGLATHSHLFFLMSVDDVYRTTIKLGGRRK